MRPQKGRHRFRIASESMHQISRCFFRSSISLLALHFSRFSLRSVWLIFYTVFSCFFAAQAAPRHISHERAARESCSPLRFVFGGCCNLYLYLCRCIWARLSLNSPASASPSSGHFESPFRSCTVPLHSACSAAFKSGFGAASSAAKMRVKSVYNWLEI